jgi:hypothetical protein
VCCESGFVDRQFFLKVYRARDRLLAKMLRLLAKMLGRSLTRLLGGYANAFPGSSTGARCPCAKSHCSEVSRAEAAATDRAPHRRLQLIFDPILRRR